MGGAQGTGRPTPSRAEEWPLIGRGRELLVLEKLTCSKPGRACLLTGPAGVGKSRLALEALHRAGERGHPILHVGGNVGLASLPLGIFAPLLPNRVESTEDADLVRRTAAAIAGPPGRRAPVIVVDDAQFADEVSKSVLVELVVTGRAFLYLTVRTEGTESDSEIDGLARLAVEHLAVAPLGADVLDDLLSSVLGGPVERASAHWLSTHSGGNPLFLRELILAAAEAGALVAEEGLWRLSSTETVSPRLIELIGARMRALPEAQKEAIAAIAIGEPVGLTEVEGMVTPETVTSLAEHGLVAVEEAGARRAVRLAHPLYGDVVRSRTPQVLARQIKRMLAERLERTGARRRDDPLRIGLWRLASGSAGDPATMLAAARVARRHGDPRLAERLAAAAVAAGAGFDADLLLAQLWFLLGRADGSRRLLADLRARTLDDGQLVEVTCTLMDVLALAFDAIDEAVRAAVETEEELASDDHRNELAIRRAQLLLLVGRVAEALNLLEPLLDRVTGRALAAAAIAGSQCLAEVGRFGEAEELSRRGYQAHRSLAAGSLTMGAHSHIDHQCMAILYAGRLNEAEQLTRSAYEEAAAGADLEAQGSLCMLHARTLLGRGRVADAARFAGEAVGLLRLRPPAIVLRAALATAAQAEASRAGGAARARRYLDELDGLGIPAGYVLGPEVLVARAWTEVADGNLAGARRHLDSAVAMARESGAATLEAVALHDLARLGQPAAVSGRLGELARLIEGPMIGLRADHAAALRDADVAGLIALAERFEGIGADLLAAEAARSAAVTHRRSGHGVASRRAEARAIELTARCQGACTPGLASMEIRAELTPRELEVAGLAAAGLSSSAIAEALGISVRTVENQLQRCYEKLAVTSRAGLGEKVAGRDVTPRVMPP